MVTKQDVKKIATLARLEIAEAELEKFTGQMNQVLDFVKQLEVLDTSKIEPTSHAISGQEALREDQVVPLSLRDEALKNAPEADGKFFTVPRVI